MTQPKGRYLEEIKVGCQWKENTIDDKEAQWQLQGLTETKEECVESVHSSNDPRPGVAFDDVTKKCLAQLP